MSFELLDYESAASSQQTVVIVDDELTSRMILAQIANSIHENVVVVPFEDPFAASGWLKNNQPDLVMLDYRMTGMSGLELLQHIRGIPHMQDVPVVVVTAVDARDVRYQMLDAGATDFIVKPIDPYECRARCRNLLDLSRHRKIVADRAHSLEDAVAEATEKVLDREYETLFRLAKAGEYRDAETGNHILRMARYSRLIAEAMGLNKDRCHLIELAAPMHDIGKIGVPDSVLLKPGKLNPGEYNTMKSHPLIGYAILEDSSSQFLSLGAEIALGHHEKYDGTGYPQGTKGVKIPLEARIVAVADVFDALVSDRPYKKGWTNEQALEYLIAGKGAHFDPQCVDAFIHQYNKIFLVQQQLRDFPKKLPGQGSR
jgi:two-component system, response regulator RpfG